MQKKFLGHGIGLRRKHYKVILENRGELPDWFEVVPENFMGFGGKSRQVIDLLIDQKIPLISHGVGLSIGSPDPLDPKYVKSLKEFTQYIDSAWFSDHLCFSSLSSHQYHDLLPVILNKSSLETISDKIKAVQDQVQRPFAIENISYYGTSSHNTLKEWDFINELTHKSDCFILLDINNIFVNSKNLNINAHEFIDHIDLSRVIQTHLAGHKDKGDYLLDTHGDFVCNEVWDLYKYFLEKCPHKVSTLIEWDHNIPAFDIVLSEAQKARNYFEKINYE